MFWQIALYELKYRMTRLSTHVYFGIFLLASFLMGLMIAGVFEGVDAAVAGGGGNVYANSPFVISGMIFTFSFFGVIITASFMGQALYKDFEHRMHPLLFTTPMRKSAYLGGRFVGALLANLYVFLSFVPGLVLAGLLPFADADQFGPYQPMAYVQPYLVMVLPNLFFTGAFFFALVAFTREMLPNYVGGVLLLLGYTLAGVLVGDVENLTAAALADPFGSYAYEAVSRYWTVAEKNALSPPLSGLLLYNRLIWVGAGVLILAGVFARFRFSHAAFERKAKKKATLTDEVQERAVIDRLALPAAGQSFSGGMHLTQMWSLAKREFFNVVQNVYFYVLVLAALLIFIVAATQQGAVFGTPTLPVTYQVTGLVSGSFALFMLIIIVFYAGELIWRERDLKANQIHDALPIPTWLPFTAKLLALWMVCALLMAVMMVCGIGYQVFKGYYNFEIGVYLSQLFGVQLIDFMLLAVLAMLVHVLVNHKYMGHFVLILYYIGLRILMGQFDLEHNLYDYNSDPGVVYSDMNRFGHFLGPYFWFKLYWAAFALMLAVMSNLLWVRGQEAGLKWRFKLARLRLSRTVLFELGAGLLIFLGVGAFIFYNTNILNEYRTSDEGEALQARYEQLYKQYDGIPQPRITGVNVNVDIFPEGRDAYANGTYVLKNKTAAPVDSVHVNLPAQIEIEALAFDREARRVLADSTLGYYIFGLAEPLAPGDSMRLHFELALTTRGFQNSGSNTQIVENGTFFNSGIFPSIGYSEGGELSDDDTREDHGLEPKERMAVIDDSTARMNTYIARDADWIDFEATVSTVPEQIAIAPGYLQREWVEDGRRYFHYKMDAPILNFYAFLSAEYEVATDSWTNPEGEEVAIEVYYHEGHPYNVERMIYAVKQSLDYFTANFSPYQHRQVRIIEFPRYASFAQSFPNTIPYSESIGFIAAVEDEEDIDYPFYVTAHEVAHQWWAHQVIGGAVQGSTLLSETLSQYSALMVMEQEYGTDQMKRFLGYELDQYLVGRTFERKKEKPLLYVENQQYIHYRKGSLVMYALQDYIGEDSLNLALSRYIDDVAFQEPPYTNARELLEHIEAVTPDSLSYLLEDLFETITLYQNRIVDATYAPADDGTYDVMLTIETKKVRADSLGNEDEVPMNDWLDIGIFAGEAVDGTEQEVPLYLEKHRFTEGEHELQITVDRKPERAGIDPYFKFIDRIKQDNVKAVKEE